MDGHEYPGLEILARECIERAKTGLAPDVGVVVFLSHLGEQGGIAYMSTIERADVAAMLTEWLDRAVLKADGAFQRKVRDAIDAALAR